ncbi:hypothetical protein niasHT_030017 [Heterodera trifolii]|uniref:Uncharacterized protein n=1 Tax=Heterodera trifolii TaxID=157864 RepID=A0ABD2JRS8_9BILA
MPGLGGNNATNVMPPQAGDENYGTKENVTVPSSGNRSVMEITKNALGPKRWDKNNSVHYIWPIVAVIVLLFLYLLLKKLISCWRNRTLPPPSPPAPAGDDAPAEDNISSTEVPFSPFLYELQVVSSCSAHRRKQQQEGTTPGECGTGEGDETEREEEEEV